ncbi:sensor histidine kinase [Bacillus niameyensis]|uniref:sensor histidine kinase n=1 Tax=Bacillus niameyensis TaxID=1522308 RepID=UPI000784A00C|nr:HAMP domain-containing sensor histidine kinase [Bacillus niameyensis]
MKLWLKVSLISMIMITLATSICSLILLIRSGKSNLELAIENTITDQQMRVTSWSTAMENAVTDEYGVTSKRSLARYLIDKFADQHTVLLSDGDVIYNATSINPEDYLPMEEDMLQYIIQDIDNRSILIVGSGLQIGETNYHLYKINDISSVYSNIKNMAYQFAIINLIILFVSGVTLIFLIRLILRPISILKQNTGLIASGIYDKRIVVAEKDEIGELATNFNQMVSAIEKNMKDLREEVDRRTLFMSALTHELKTPMTSISGNAQTLLYTKMDEEEREDALLRIYSDCTRIERLSQKLLQLIVLRQKDSIPMNPYNVARLLEDVQLMCAEQLKDRQLTLSINNNIGELMMDRDLMESLLLNLIDNAGKASKPGDTIDVLAKENTILVKDQGVGISHNELNKITQPFYMVDPSRSRKSDGTGFGLALVEEIARLHHAKLLFDSTPGKGTTVKVVFNYDEKK